MKQFCTVVFSLVACAAQAALLFLDFEQDEGCTFSPSKDDATGIRGFSESFATSGRRSFRLGSTEEDAMKTGYAVAELRRKGGPVSDLSAYDRLVFDAVNLDEDEKSVPIYPVVGAERVRKARFVAGFKPFEVTTAVVPLSTWRAAGVDLKDVRGLRAARRSRCRSRTARSRSARPTPGRSSLTFGSTSPTRQPSGTSAARTLMKRKSISMSLTSSGALTGVSRMRLIRCGTVAPTTVHLRSRRASTRCRPKTHVRGCLT